MKSSVKNAFLWTLSIVFTLLVVYYQRATGPTHPKTGTILINGNEIHWKLLRTHGGKGAAPVMIKTGDTVTEGILAFKRYKSNDRWIKVLMKRQGDTLYDSLPHQPPAGKVMYTVTLKNKGKEYKLTQDPVILRFKGAVPPFILLPHILFMFFAMLFGVRAAMEALTKGNQNRFFTGVTLVCIIVGGLILGPIVQKYAFGAFWTGWPFGHDLTDNKTFVVFLFWLIAWMKLRKNELHRTWILIATLIMLVVYSIPHSVMGSEIDYTKQQTEQQK